MMQRSLVRRAGLDAHENDSRFVEYYERASETQSARGRALGIMGAVLRARAEASLSVESLDVADIGCNAGSQSLCWLERMHRVRGLDVSADLVAKAIERSSQFDLAATYEVGTAESLPWDDECVDVALLPELLEHVRDWEACLREAVRILRPAGTLFLSTTNALCPVQQEFNLPGYSWYPRRLKNYFLAKATSTNPELANYATYPAYHWFTPYSLRRYLDSFHMTVLDRFDLIDTLLLGKVGRVVVGTTKAFPPARFVGHVLTEGSRIVAHKLPPAES